MEMETIISRTGLAMGLLIAVIICCRPWVVRNFLTSPPPLLAWLVFLVNQLAISVAVVWTLIDFDAKVAGVSPISWASFQVIATSLVYATYLLSVGDDRKDAKRIDTAT